MPRPRLFAQNGPRRSLTLSAHLDEEIRILAAKRMIPISILIEELVTAGLKASKNQAWVAIEFPEKWDGRDLQERLIQLRRRQLDLAQALKVNPKTLGNWVRGDNPFPPAKLQEIQEILQGWHPDDVEHYQPGSHLPLGGRAG